jgi:hypothetical protein
MFHWISSACPVIACGNEQSLKPASSLFARHGDID